MRFQCLARVLAAHTNKRCILRLNQNIDTKPYSKTVPTCLRNVIRGDKYFKTSYKLSETVKVIYYKSHYYSVRGTRR